MDTTQVNNAALRNNTIANNDNTEALNDRTPIQLSIKNLWGFILIVVGITAYYLYSQFSTISDIRAIKQDVAYIKEQNQVILDRYISLEDRYGKMALELQKVESTLDYHIK